MPSIDFRNIDGLDAEISLRGGGHGVTQVNVLDYGADPTGVADSSAAINAAILALPPLGGEVFIPPGDYRCMTTITLGNGSQTAGVSTRSGIILKGGSPPGPYPSQYWFNPLGFWRGTTRLFSGAATTMIVVSGPFMGWGIKNLYLDGVHLGITGLEEISVQGGDCENVVITDFTSTAQFVHALHDTAPVNIGPNHAMNSYKNFTLWVPNIAFAKGILARGNQVEATTDSFGNKWENLIVVFAQITDTIHVYGIMLQSCDNQYFHNVMFEASGATTGTGFYTCIALDYTGPFAQMPADCHFDVVEVDWTKQTTQSTPFVLNVGSPPAIGVQSPNTIEHISFCNGRPPNPNLPGLIWDGIKRPLVKSVAGSSNVTLNANENACAIMEFTGAIGANIDVIVDRAAGTEYTVFNNTSGAFTLRIIGTAGTGTIVATGKRARLYGDGTNIVRATADV